MKKLLYIALALSINTVYAQNIRNNPNSNHGNKFEQLGTILPDANTYRTASGAPGHQYWQQRADYKIDVELNENDYTISGTEYVTYFNNSPDELLYLWFQLDENEHDPKSDNNSFDGSSMRSKTMNEGDIAGYERAKMLEGYGVQIFEVADQKGKAVPYTINQTMMRVDLPTPLKPKQKVVLKIRWKYQMPERMRVGGRGGRECFADGSCLFTVTQWFPRLCVYSDYQGWNNKQFTGRGEFALTFGNYDVKMTVPADHIIAATGECQNYKDVSIY